MVLSVKKPKSGSNTKYSRANRPLNRFGKWCAEKGVTGPALDRLLGVGKNQSYHYIVPLDHDRFAIPRPAVMARIVELTDGQVQPNDFYDIPKLAALTEAAA